MISASLVKELRDKTNAGMMDCKKALTDTNGDLDAAIKLLREKGIAMAAKKADREANEGVIVARIDPNGKAGVLLEVNCETDFVAKNDNFQAFVAELADAVAASGADSLEAALAVPHNGATIDDLVKHKVTEMGEKLQFRRFVRYAVTGEGVVAFYIHLGGKVGVLIEVGTEKADTTANQDFRDFVKDLTLHIAASNPKGLAREDIPADLVESEKDIFRVQLAETGKPAEMIEKILVGKMSKFFAESCLLEQGFVKDPDTTVKAMLEAKGKAFADTLSVRRFTRFAVGE